MAAAVPFCVIESRPLEIPIRALVSPSALLGRAIDAAVTPMDPPPNSGTGPTPREVAQLAIADMKLTAINIGIAPRAEDSSIGIVGMPVWMWAASPNEHTWGPNTASASAGVAG